MRTDSFRIETAIFLAAICSQTYTQYESKDESFIVPAGFQLVGPFRAKSFDGISESFGFILQSSEQVIVAFRGTSSTSDWISDAMARQIKYKWVPNSGWTHKGFTEIYESARKQIHNILKAVSPYRKLIVTGHSLGAALATLCAVDLSVNSTFKNPIVYTYGSPRVGDANFVRCFNQSIGTTNRIHNKYDVVTHLPTVLIKMPKSDTWYSYIHVQMGHQLEFQNGSVSANHIISSYFDNLAKSDPIYTEQLRKHNPGLCP